MNRVFRYCKHCLLVTRTMFILLASETPCAWILSRALLFRMEHTYYYYDDIIIHAADENRKNGLCVLRAVILIKISIFSLCTYAWMVNVYIYIYITHIIYNIIYNDKSALTVNIVINNCYLVRCRCSRKTLAYPTIGRSSWRGPVSAFL